MGVPASPSLPRGIIAHNPGAHQTKEGRALSDILLLQEGSRPLRVVFYDALASEATEKLKKGCLVEVDGYTEFREIDIKEGKRVLCDFVGEEFRVLDRPAGAETNRMKAAENALLKRWNSLAPPEPGNAGRSCIVCRGNNEADARSHAAELHIKQRTTWAKACGFDRAMIAEGLEMSAEKELAKYWECRPKQ